MDAPFHARERFLSRARPAPFFDEEPELAHLGAKVGAGTSTVEALREVLALTIAVVGACEQLHRSLAPQSRENWETLERSAATFTDEFVVEWLANADVELKKAITQHRRRKLTAQRGSLSLVESERNKSVRWARVTLKPDDPLPIAEEVGEGLEELTFNAEERLYAHLGATNATDPLVLAGQAVGLLTAAECLLALFPSNKVAAFCVQIAALTAQHA